MIQGKRGQISSKADDFTHLLCKAGRQILLEASDLGLGFQKQASCIRSCYFRHVKSGVEAFPDPIQHSERTHNKCECGRKPAAKGTNDVGLRFGSSEILIATAWQSSVSGRR